MWAALVRLGVKVLLEPKQDQRVCGGRQGTTAHQESRVLMEKLVAGESLEPRADMEHLDHQVLWATLATQGRKAVWASVVSLVLLGNPVPKVLEEPWVRREDVAPGVHRVSKAALEMSVQLELWERGDRRERPGPVAQRVSKAPLVSMEMLGPQGSQVHSAGLEASGPMAILAHVAELAKQEPKAPWGVWVTLARLDTVDVSAKQEKLALLDQKEMTSSTKLMVPNNLRSVLVAPKE